MKTLIHKYLNKWAVLAAVLFLVVQVACDLYLPTVTVQIVDRGIIHNNLPYIWMLGRKMIFITLIGLACSVGNIYFAATQSQGMGSKIRAALYHKVINFSNQNLDHFGSASLITRATNDVTQIQNLMINVLRMMIMSPLMLIGAIALALNQSPKLSITFFVALIVLAGVLEGINLYAMPRFRSLQRQTDHLNLIFREGLTGVRVIRAFNRDLYELRRFSKANHKYTNTAVHANVAAALMFPLLTFILSLTNIGIVSFGSLLIAHHELEVGNLVAFMTYSTMILFSFMMLAMLFVFVPRAEVSAKRIEKVLKQPEQILDPEQPQTIPAGTPASLEFKHVSLSYPNGQTALRNLSFKALAGQTVAIVGDTGSGKSSIVDLIPRLYDPTNGQIKLDGIPLKELTQADVHQHVALTQQESQLFSGTVRSNLLFGDEQASDTAMWHALKVAQAANFIKAAKGLDTHVAQNGDNFSGGQKQRLTIARTVLKHADIYIFDDSFSALDFATDAKVRAGLDQDLMLKPAVKVLVAQRLSTVRKANLIIVLHHGDVVGKGTHEELLKSNHFYQVLYRSQIQKGGRQDAE